jgi:RNA recognition motif-containing protein
LEEKKNNEKKQILNDKENNGENISNTNTNLNNIEQNLVITQKGDTLSEENEVSNTGILPDTEKDPSKCLLITNLQRPFVNSALESLLAKYGKITNFWLDFIKTHCYVQVLIFCNFFSFLYSMKI